MKKVFSFIFVLGLGLSLASCNNKNNDSNSEDGRYTIYKLAQESNYKGTYEEWLESIKGDKIELSVIDDSLKWKYSEEPDTAYKTLVNLSTLKGKDGQNGKDGTNGKDGIDGKNGVNAKEVTDISSIKVGNTTIFTFKFNDNSEIKTELVEKKETIRNVNSTTKEINAYKAFKYSTTSNYYEINLYEEEYQLGKCNLRFVENESLVPYISLAEMSKLYTKYLKNNEIVSKVEDVDGASIWSVKTNNTKNALVKIDPINQQIMIDGSFDKVYNSAVDRSKYSLAFESKVTTETINPNSVTYLSYEGTDFKAFKENDVYYYPFGLLNSALGYFTNHRFFYNYSSIYEYDEFSNLSQIDLIEKEGADSFNVMEQMEKYINNNYSETDAAQHPKMPLYLRYNNRSEFIFDFENFYGLASTRNIKSMKSYFENYGIYDEMINDNSVIRGKAYSKAAFILEDNHTAKGNTSSTPWGEDNGGAGIENATLSKLIDERRTFGKFLSDERKKALKAAGKEEDDKFAILYSADGQTAYFYFDSFDASSNAYKNGVKKTNDELAKEDSYYFFIKQLNEIKAHRTTVDGVEVKVKNVVIDDSQNGGGYVYILGKLLALISKDNKGVIYTQNELTKEISKSTFQVDSNNDNVYDENDAYGNDFDFYILTSNQSFSCGNALPCVASGYSHVKIIGDRSGGGECVVDQSLLSNGIFYYHSGVEHLINYNETTKEKSGVEDGQGASGNLSFADYYNIEALNKLIKDLNKPRT